MNKAILKRVLKSIRPYIWLLILSTICALIYVCLSLYIPILIGRAIDVIIDINNVDFVRLGDYFVEIGITLIIASVAQYAMGLLNNRICFSVCRDLRNKGFKKIQKLPLSYLDAHPLGDIISRMIVDVDTLSDGLLLGFSQLFTGVISIVVTLVYMFALNYIMALVVVILTPISLFAARFIASRIHRYFLAQTKLRGEQAAFIEEMVSGQKVVRAFNHEEENQEQFDEICTRLKVASLKANFFSSLVNPTTRFVNALVYAVIAFIGALIVINMPLFTPGMLSTFLTYSTQYTKPFNDISSVITELQNALTSAGRVYELLDEKEEKKDVENAKELIDVQGEISLEHVYFSYTKEQRLIEDFNLQVHSGEKVAIVGPTGCGKTTLINLLMRFYDVNEGVIKIDQQPLDQIKRTSIRENYGMVLQDTWLRYGTIKDNIKMGSDVSDQEVIQAAKMSHAHDFIERLPKGYDTIIDENGGQLSQGQKQLLCIARIMLNIPPMLILDEATSSIDTRTELKIQDAFDVLMKGRTSFIVAHRLSTIKGADIILVMKDGHIIEQGTHLELLKKKGFYSHLYNSQFDN